MNFTEDFVQNLDTEFDYKTCPEIIINPRFYGNQSLDNLVDLKLRAHYLLNVIFKASNRAISNFIIWNWPVYKYESYLFVCCDELEW